jgi:hypothetical protein
VLRWELQCWIGKRVVDSIDPQYIFGLKSGAKVGGARLDRKEGSKQY